MSALCGIFIFLGTTYTDRQGDMLSSGEVEGIRKAAVAQDLDATGLFCPEPVMLLHNRIREMAAGQLLRLTATDPSTVRDVTKFCMYLGHELVQRAEGGGEFWYLIRKGSSDSNSSNIDKTNSNASGL